MKIDTVNYDYPSCGGIKGNYNPKTGIFIFTKHSNYQGNFTDRKIRLELTPMERSEGDLIQISNDFRYVLPGSKIKILRKGFKVQ